MEQNGKGILIVVEGLDGSGKETQTSILYERLLKEGLKVKKIEFPRYDSQSSALIKMYLSGEFGEKAEDVSPYVASTFYAVDRYASYKQEWENFHEKGGVIIADRYTTSNMIHQAGKIKDVGERQEFLDWLWDLEFYKYKLPQPDVVFFLDVGIKNNQKLMEGRTNKFSGQSAKDIHEKDIRHLQESYVNALDLADRYNWHRIDCVKGNQLRTIEDINAEVFAAAHKKIFGTLNEVK